MDTEATTLDVVPSAAESEERPKPVLIGATRAQPMDRSPSDKCRSHGALPHAQVGGDDAFILAWVAVMPRFAVRVCSWCCLWS